MWFIGIVIVFVLGIIIGGSAALERAKAIEQQEVGMRAYGYDETNQLWHRIRVDQHGHVICGGKDASGRD